MFDFKTPEPRTGMPDVQLSEAEFKRRYHEQFADPAFAQAKTELDRIASIAWANYDQGHKAPNTSKAGPGYADPDYDLSDDWIAARAAIDAAQVRHDDPALPRRILLINASSRSDHTCPGEMSKSWRMVEIAKKAVEAADIEVEILDLSRLASEYGRKIHPCKACYSTSPALCHFPCSCYPNHGMGQTQDWMNEIYPMWVAAHGVMIVTPVNWYQATSPLKLMIDRLVCADGGNTDPTRTKGKDAKLAKKIELEGWDYPRHLKGRLFATVVHGDTEGVGTLKRILADWMKSMDMEPAGNHAEIDRYIGYWKPYATSHVDFDADKDLQEEVRNAALTLAEAVRAKRAGKMVSAGSKLEEPREK